MSQITDFYDAIENNQVDAVKQMINDIDLHMDDEGSLTLAIQSGHLDIVKLLVENGADINANINESYNPLRMAISDNQTLIVQYLIEQGADIGVISNDVTSQIQNDEIRQLIETQKQILNKEELPMDEELQTNHSNLFMDSEMQEQAVEKAYEQVNEKLDEATVEKKISEDNLEKFNTTVEEAKKVFGDVRKNSKDNFQDRDDVSLREISGIIREDMDVLRESFEQSIVSIGRELDMTKEQIDKALDSVRAEADRQHSEAVKEIFMAKHNKQELEKEPNEKERIGIFNYINQKQSEMRHNVFEFLKSAADNVKEHYKAFNADVKAKTNAVKEFTRDFSVCAKEAAQIFQNKADDLRIKYYKTRAFIDEKAINVQLGILKNMRNIDANIKACANMFKAKNNHERANAYVDGLTKANEKTLKRYEKLTKNLSHNLASYAVAIANTENRQYNREMSYQFWDPTHTRAELTDPQNPAITDAITWGCKELANDEQKRKDFLDLYNRTLLNEQEYPKLDANQITEMAKMLDANIPKDVVSKIAESEVPALNMTAMRLIAQKDMEFVNSTNAKEMLSLGQADLMERAATHYKEALEKYHEKPDMKEFACQSFIANKIDFVETELSPLSKEQEEACLQNVKDELNALYGVDLDNDAINNLLDIDENDKDSDEFEL